MASSAGINTGTTKEGDITLLLVFRAFRAVIGLLDDACRITSGDTLVLLLFITRVCGLLLALFILFALPSSLSLTGTDKVIFGMGSSFTSPFLLMSMKSACCCSVRLFSIGTAVETSPASSMKTERLAIRFVVEKIIGKMSPSAEGRSTWTVEVFGTPVEAGDRGGELKSERKAGRVTGRSVS